MAFAGGGWEWTIAVDDVRVVYREDRFARGERPGGEDAEAFDRGRTDGDGWGKWGDVTMLLAGRVTIAAKALCLKRAPR